MAAPQSPEGAGQIAEALLETIEAFADTNPIIANAELEFGEIGVGETPAVRTMVVKIGDDEFLLIAKRVGG